ncbi:hypothetical protein B0H19DRAFT_1235382 [Mycena capillaripes]|nr:hypothetical protein B0H19DRAFT_1235382 [Mycena capillaripes]
MVSTLWYDISQLWVGTFFYGIYLVLFCICMYILLHRPSSRGNTVLMVTTMALFTFSTILIVLILVLVTAEIEELSSIPSDSIQNAAYIIYAINNSIGDGLLIYRCYVVWNHDWRVIVLPVMMLIASTAGRIWWISHHSRAYLAAAAQQRYASTIALVVESGMLYSATILAFLIVISFPSLSSTLEEPLLQIVTQVMGIAPTLIIVRVGMGLTVEESLSSFRAAKNPGMPLHQQRHAGSRLGTSIGSADPRENFAPGYVARENDHGFGKPRYLGDAAV